MMNETKGFDEVFNCTPQVTQSQESLVGQMILGISLANRFGLYDLADYLRKKINQSQSNYYS